MEGGKGATNKDTWMGDSEGDTARGGKMVEVGSDPAIKGSGGGEPVQNVPETFELRSRNTIETRNAPRAGDPSGGEHCSRAVSTSGSLGSGKLVCNFTEASNIGRGESSEKMREKTQEKAEEKRGRAPCSQRWNAELEESTNQENLLLKKKREVEG